MISNNKISNLVATQLPFFVRNDHQNFVAFLEAYYEFLEQETGAGNISRSLLDQSDIDLSDLFVQKFYDNFLPFIPKDTAVDKTLILKNVKDFYRSKGTEKSIRFLMRVLFDEEVDFYYPQRDVLRASDGKWFVEKSIKIRDTLIDNVANNELVVVNNFSGRQIIGRTSNAFATVETSDTYYEGDFLVRELKISGQVGEFTSGEQIYAVFEENGINRIISANLFSGSISSVQLIKPGSGYKVGDAVAIESNTGSGGAIIVSSVSTGNLTSIVAFNGGAGFQVGNQLLITGGGGSGANANVATVSANNYYHPNTYNIYWSTIDLEANTTIGNTTYANLSNSITDPANTAIANVLSYFVYANTGPIETVLLYSPGTQYLSLPTISSQANTRVRNLGILGRMKINDGGQGYSVNDSITFTNVTGGYGVGAAGRVRAVNTANLSTITEVEFVNVPGHITGGSGYDQFYLPTVNVISTNAQAFGANVIVEALLGTGEVLIPVGSTAGSIERLTILSRGSGYTTAPTLNLTQLGDGTAQATVGIISGAYTYPGRYINDDGHISSYNFIQDRDYYQKFSYVIKVKQSIEKYRQALKELIHPAGLKLFGEYSFFDEGETLRLRIKGTNEEISVIHLKSYEYANANLTINYTGHGLTTNDYVSLDWVTGNVVNNAVEGPYDIRLVPNANSIIIVNDTYLANTSLPPTSGNVYVGKII